MHERTTRVAIVAGLSIGLAVGAPDSFTPAVEAVPVVPAEDLRYSIVDGQATITGCGGHDCQEGLVIPAAITSNIAGTPPIVQSLNHACPFMKVFAAPVRSISPRFARDPTPVPGLG